MRNHDGRLVGIFGTIIIHLIAGIIFMSFRISSLQKTAAKQFMIEFAPVENLVINDKKIEVPVSSADKILQDDQEMLNIARNLANKSNVNINKTDYIEKVKEELIKSGKLGTDNFIDKQKMKAENKGDENLAIADDSTNTGLREKPKESQVMESNYKGPTRIYYDLAGRIHTYLPLPIYMCEGAGKVTLSIEVNQRGDVIRARVISGQSTTSDPCLIETAQETALMSRFNADIKSPSVQIGTLTYMFVAQ